MTISACWLEDAPALGERREVEERLELVVREVRVVAEGREAVRRAVPVRDRALVDAHRRGEMFGHERRDLARVEAGGELAAHVEQPPQLAGERLAAGQQAGRLERRRRLVGEDQQESLVLAVELVEPELRERDDPDRQAVVGHRDDEHRLVDIVGPGIDSPRGSAFASPTSSGAPCSATQPVNPWPSRHRSSDEVDLLVRADDALERDRHDLVAPRSGRPGRCGSR